MQRKHKQRGFTEQLHQKGSLTLHCLWLTSLIFFFFTFMARYSGQQNKLAHMKAGSKASLMLYSTNDQSRLIKMYFSEHSDDHQSFVTHQN